MSNVEKRRIDFWTKLRVVTTFPGDWESIFKGEGDEFFDLKEYRPGDDYRKIHWASFAKTGGLYLRENVAQRELKAYFLLDVGPSMFFHDKPHIVDGLLAITGVSAVEAHIPFGCMAFDDEPVVMMPARQGRSPFLQVANWVLAFNPRTDHPTRFSEELCAALLRNVPRNALVFLVSDFLSPDVTPACLTPFVRACDVVPVIVRDPFEVDFPASGEFSFRDTFSGREERVVLGERERALIRTRMREHLVSFTEGLRIEGIDSITVETSKLEAIFEKFYTFFRLRKGRRVKA